VLLYNPKSGGGKAERFHLANEARARGIKPIELKLGTDLEHLVRGAVADGPTPWSDTPESIPVSTIPRTCSRVRSSGSARRS
jgi:hypothetical protein